MEVYLLERKDGKNQALRMIDLARVPTVKEKVVFDIEGIGTIFEVIDVHFADHCKTDVIVIRLSTITEYYRRVVN